MNLDKVETGYPWYPYLVRWFFYIFLLKMMMLQPWWSFHGFIEGKHSQIAPRSCSLAKNHAYLNMRSISLTSNFEKINANIILYPNIISKYNILYHTNIYKHISISNCLYPNIILYPSKQFKHFFESVWVISIARFFLSSIHLGSSMLQCWCSSICRASKR